MSPFVPFFNATSSPAKILLRCRSGESTMNFPHLQRTPSIASSAFIAKSATVIGDVAIDEGSSIWFGSVVRGDVQSIRIGRNTNIQDLVVVHVSTNGQPTEIGNHVTVGHSAVLHSCRLDDFAFVGFGARVLDTAVIESDGFLAAGAILTPGKIIRTREMWAGNPAKFVRVLSDEAVEANRKIAPRYADLAAEYLALTTTNARG